ncbi:MULTISPECIES: 6-phosphogluconolactonase [unclassified Neisseria]|uniref:6-phosphogluconolactonase n=1 Tax=unclassified Neisseria TaxID=2623750 RepID=UPI00266631C9|nr:MULTISPECIES: 6-phosphogluconolactonase [unclassified Neisseria]MDO1510506.1 6-phosphogluconolactonase [Neisseria sp. MVDL19-042950]MDO1516675.1 6-phosphogluconolactonase [Neisseria sp. MVDL18-041461]MDO1563822.1 6-phosphogluconolactonase [Neisseria sp. MVDL20-010259]
MAYQWHHHESAAASAAALADAVAAALKVALDKRGNAVLAVSGGRSPIAFFEALSQKDLDWAHIAVTLVDERIVPTDHPDSNTGLVHEYLLKNKAAAAKWIPVVEAERQAADLQPEAVVQTALKHYRQPDALVLGMGGDGHTASLFPQAPQLDSGLDLANEAPLLHTTPVTAPHERVSMTLAAIAKTPAVFLAIQGAEKKAVFDQTAAALSKSFPISYVINNKKVNCHVHYAE